MNGSRVEPVSHEGHGPAHRSKWEWVLILLSFLVGGLLFHTWILAYLVVVTLYIRNIVRLIRRGIESYSGPGEGISNFRETLASQRSNSSLPPAPRRDHWYVRALVSKRRWSIIARALVAPPIFALALYSIQLLLFITGSVDRNTNEPIQEPFFPIILIVVTGIYYIWAGNALRDGTPERPLVDAIAAPDPEALRTGS